MLTVFTYTEDCADYNGVILNYSSTISEFCDGLPVQASTFYLDGADLASSTTIKSDIDCTCATSQYYWTTTNANGGSVYFLSPDCELSEVLCSSSVVVCDEQQYEKIDWHPLWPESTSNSADVKSRVQVSNFASAPGSITWLAIGLQGTNGNDTSTSDVYVGTQYWIKMSKYSIDNVLHNTPSVTFNNQLVLEELNSSSNLTGNSITFTVDSNAQSITFGQEFLFPATVSAQSGYGLTTPALGYNSGPSYNGDSTLCVSQNTIITSTCDPAVGVKVENEYTVDYLYPSSLGGPGPISPGPSPSPISPSPSPSPISPSPSPFTPSPSPSPSPFSPGPEGFNP